MFSYNEILFQRKLSKKVEWRLYKWPPARPEVKLPESEILRNELKLLLCLLILFTLIFCLNLSIHSIYHFHHIQSITKLEPTLAMIQNIEEEQMISR